MRSTQKIDRPIDFSVWFIVHFLTGPRGYPFVRLTGVTYSFGTHGEAWLAMIDASGDIQWQRTCGSPDYIEEAHSAQQIADGVIVDVEPLPVSIPNLSYPLLQNLIT